MSKAPEMRTSDSAISKLQPHFDAWNKARERKPADLKEKYFTSGDPEMPNVRLADLRPLRDLVLVKRLPMPEGTISDSIIAPDTAQKSEMFGSFARTFNQSTYGVVVRTGPGRRDEEGHRIPMEVGPGDLVMWGQYIDLEDGDLVLISEKDIRWVEKYKLASYEFLLRVGLEEYRRHVRSLPRRRQ